MLVSATVATIALLFAGGSSQASASAESEARLLNIETLRRLDFSDETKLKYTMPAVLAAAYPDGVNHRESYFGTPNYGSHLGRIFYATPNETDTVCLCSNRIRDYLHNLVWLGPRAVSSILSSRYFVVATRTNSQLACISSFFLQGCNTYPSHPDWTAAAPFVLLVDRGSCSFTTKARMAAGIEGASAFIIADNQQRLGDPDCTCDDSTKPSKNADGQVLLHN